MSNTSSGAVCRIRGSSRFNSRQQRCCQPKSLGCHQSRLLVCRTYLCAVVDVCCIKDVLEVLHAWTPADPAQDTAHPQHTHICACRMQGLPCFKPWGHVQQTTKHVRMPPSCLLAAAAAVDGVLVAPTAQDSPADQTQQVPVPPYPYQAPACVLGS